MNSLHTKAEIIHNEKLSKSIIRLTFHAPVIADQASPGQFVMVKAGRNFEPLLRRPFSIHQTTADGLVQILFRVVGIGSEYLAEKRKGEVLDLLGPLGQGFALPTDPAVNICIVGGGMGCAPLYFLVKKLLRNHHPATLQVYLGASTSDEILPVIDDFKSLGVNVVAATDDGTLGYHGYVTDLCAALMGNEDKWQFYTCGPQPMMKKVVECCEAKRWPCQVSLETVMACGISACLGCTVQISRDKAATTQKKFLHVCKDGPVFDYGDVEWSKGGGE